MVQWFGLVCQGAHIGVLYMLPFPASSVRSPINWQELSSLLCLLRGSLTQTRRWGKLGTHFINLRRMEG